uniref:Ankyrin repeat protein n=1 Tax=Trichogramma kaykai TaxID=54128 RepID=A0ABD2XNG8_9HYME
MIKLLIQYQADVNLTHPILALFRCKYFNNDVDVSLRKKVLKLLLENNADPSVACGYQGTIPTMIFYRMNSNDSTEIIKLLLKYKMNINIKDNFGRNPLHNAVRYRGIKEIKFLLQCGADPNNVDERGKT